MAAAPHPLPSSHLPPPMAFSFWRPGRPSWSSCPSLGPAVAAPHSLALSALHHYELTAPDHCALPTRTPQRHGSESGEGGEASGAGRGEPEAARASAACAPAFTGFSSKQIFAISQLRSGACWYWCFFASRHCWASLPALTGRSPEGSSCSAVEARTAGGAGGCAGLSTSTERGGPEAAGSPGPTEEGLLPETGTSWAVGDAQAFPKLGVVCSMLPLCVRSASPEVRGLS